MARSIRPIGTCTRIRVQWPRARRDDTATMGPGVLKKSHARLFECLSSSLDGPPVRSEETRTTLCLTLLHLSFQLPPRGRSFASMQRTTIRRSRLKIDPSDFQTRDFHRSRCKMKTTRTERDNARKSRLPWKPEECEFRGAPGIW